MDAGTRLWNKRLSIHEGWIKPEKVSKPPIFGFGKFHSQISEESNFLKVWILDIWCKSNG